MVEHVYRRAAQAPSVNAVLVATDDARVADVVDSFGGTAVMTSPDHATGSDRLAEVAAELESEFVVNVQGDEPLIEPGAIDAAVTTLLDSSGDVMSTLRRRIEDPADYDTPSVVKIVVDSHGYALYFTRAHVPFVRSGLKTGAPAGWRHLGLYVYRREFLLTLARLPPTPLEQAEGLEQLRALEHGYRIKTAETTMDTIGVDTPEDLERVRRLLEAGVHS
jgi:3-deoxy-manno-octulosonate cytidylyltransferase (CMP-KDO synthetase)